MDTLFLIVFDDNGLLVSDYLVFTFDEQQIKQMVFEYIKDRWQKLYGMAYYKIVKLDDTYCFTVKLTRQYQPELIDRINELQLF